ncbi:hypothetical protein DMENIID0001_152530 [Sergentomyia squamirostris]
MDSQENISHANLSTFMIEVLDKLLDGGLLIGHIYEFDGRLRVGKTLFCLSISLQFALSNKGVLFLDTNAGFDSYVARMILAKLGSPENDVRITLNRIHVQRVIDLNTLKEVLEFIIREKSEMTDYHLLIIDCMDTFFLWTFDLDFKSKEYAKNRATLTECFNLLNQVAKECGFTVILTNLVLTKKDDSKIERDSFKMGLQIDRMNENIPFTRLRIDEVSPDSAERRISVISSKLLAEKEQITLTISNKGFL